MVQFKHSKSATSRLTMLDCHCQRCPNRLEVEAFRQAAARTPLPSHWNAGAMLREAPSGKSSFLHRIDVERAEGGTPRIPFRSGFLQQES